MKIVKDDIWEYLPKGYCIIIPTNGYVNKNGEAVMGRGIAYQAKKLFKGLSFALGKNLKEYGNNVNYFERQKLITFPTKHNWKEPADLQLIKKSCEQLRILMEKKPEIRIAMPRVGCGNGKLSWDNVRPILMDYFASLDSRMIIVDNESGDCGEYYRGKNKENIVGQPEEKDRPLIIDANDYFAPGV